MLWSFKIGKIFGITFRIHVTFVLLLIFIYMSGVPKMGPEKALVSVIFICAVFACVLIHEIGHSLIARRFGKQATSIILLPIGGMAVMEEMPDKPGQEIVMSLAGPLINLAIAGILYLSVGHWSGIGAPDLYPATARSFFAGLIGVNIILAIFNLIPAFPMDGGRVLRGLLALKMEYNQATSTAVLIGQGFALLFVFVGIFYNWWLALIGVFLFIGAGSEKRQVLLGSLLKQVPVKAAMITEYIALRPEEELSKTMEHIFHGCQHDFPVIGDGGLEGVLTRNGILAAAHEKGLEVTVAEVMDRNYISVTSDSPLNDLYKRLRQGAGTAAAVVDGDDLKGIVSLDSIGRYFMIQSTLERTTMAG